MKMNIFTAYGQRSAILSFFLFFIAIFSSFLLLPSTQGYGGGGGGGYSFRSCDRPVISSLSPPRNSEIDVFERISFIVSDVEEEDISLAVNGNSVDFSVKYLEGDELLVEGTLSEPISEGSPKISIVASNSSRCSTSSVFYVKAGIKSDFSTSEVDVQEFDEAEIKDRVLLPKVDDVCDDGVSTKNCVADIINRSTKTNVRFANRGHVSEIVSRYFLGDIPSALDEKPFADVELSSEYALYVARVKSAGVAKGFGGNQFKPTKPISRVAALTMFIRAKGIDTSGADITVLKKFNDIDINDSSQQWFLKNVAWAVENGIIKGYSNSDGSSKGLFGSGDSLTKDQIALIVDRFMNK